MTDVLVVEDARVVRDYLVYLLGGDPTLHVIDTAANGAEALACVQRRKPDIIVMDIHMPVMDGIEATREIMATDPVPIVIVTASTSSGEVSTALQAV